MPLQKYEIITINRIDIFMLLTAIWLPQGRLLPIIEGQPHSFDVNHCILIYLTRKSLVPL